MEGKKTRSRSVLIVLLYTIWFYCGSSELSIEKAKTNKLNKTRGKDETVNVEVWSSRGNLSNSIIYHRVGTSLELNCSIYNHSITKIAWRRKKEWQDFRTQIGKIGDSRVLTLKLNKLTWRDNKTILWCGPRQNSSCIQGRNVTLIVGDLPEPPQDVRSRIVTMEYQIQVYWKPSPNTGGLLTTYQITFTPCFNKTYCGGSAKTFIQMHLPGKTQYVCKKYDFNILPIATKWPKIFNVTVAAENALGKSMWSPSLLVNADPSEVYPAPAPPQSLIATVGDIATEAVVDWEPAPSPHPEYTILYTIVKYIREDIENMLLQPGGSKLNNLAKDIQIKTGVESSRTSVRLTGLKPFTVYYIYITSRFTLDDSGGFSELLGPRKVRTLQGTPEPGPLIFNDSSLPLPNEPGKRNVTLVWKVPPKSAWKGIPSSMHVHYKRTKDRSPDSQAKQMSIKGPIPNGVVLPHLSAEDAYQVFLNICNKRTCGGIGPERIIKSLSDRRQSKLNQANHFPVAVGVVVSSIIVVSLIAIVFIYTRRRNSRLRRGSVQILEYRFPTIDPDYHTRYDRASQEEFNEVYDEANNPAELEVFDQDVSH